MLVAGRKLAIKFMAADIHFWRIICITIMNCMKTKNENLVKVSFEGSHGIIASSDSDIALTASLRY